MLSTQKSNYILHLEHQGCGVNLTQDSKVQLDLQKITLLPVNLSPHPRVLLVTYSSCTSLCGGHLISQLRDTYLTLVALGGTTARALQSECQKLSE